MTTSLKFRFPISGTATGDCRSKASVGVRAAMRCERKIDGGRRRNEPGDVHHQGIRSSQENASKRVSTKKRGKYRFPARRINARSQAERSTQ